MDKLDTISTINQLSRQQIPFLFIIDYGTNNNRVVAINEIDPDQILYSVNGISNRTEPYETNLQKAVFFSKASIPFNEYLHSFNKVMHHLQRGDSYLTNLTCSTPIQCNLPLRDIFNFSKAKYCLYVKDEFVVFSPETFIQIKEGRIYSFPMKGTIHGSVDNASAKILANKKEAAEHATIVDLIRNDLSKIASDVSVDKYRYIDVLKTNQGELLQVSSQISGVLPLNYNERLGDMLFELLPAGSICGAPKKKTLEIIASAETHERGFYTGVFGIFDGKELDCGVMIRFIEKQQSGFVFKSGGGITSESTAEDEYQEMVQKVYLPF